MADRDYKQMPTLHLRALAVPKRELRRQLRVLIDTRFDLQGTIDQARLRKSVGEQRAVIVAVATRGHPTDHVVTIVWRERQNRRELDPFIFARQLHQDEIGLDRLVSGLLLLFVLNRRGLARDAPKVFALKK